jgi:3D (Asp-Asp-Asp) domain-containing protein
MSLQARSVAKSLKSRQSSWLLTFLVILLFISVCFSGLLHIFWFQKYYSLQDQYNTVIDEQAVDAGILDLVFGEYNRENIQMDTVSVSAYSPTKDQTDSNPYETASGASTMIGQVAVSRDLLNKGVRFGDTILLVGIGSFIVEDTMAPRWRNKLDVLTSDKKAARLFGLQKNITMIWIKN